MGYSDCLLIDRVEILDLEEVPLAYLPGNAVRIKVKALGSLKTV